MTNKLNELKQIRDNAPFDAEFVDADVHEDGNRILTRSLEDINARIELMEQVEQLQGIKPELPPRFEYDGKLPRYGINWNGENEPLTKPMDDGYWTPYHLVEQLQQSIKQAQIEVVERLYKAGKCDADCIEYLEQLKQSGL